MMHDRHPEADGVLEAAGGEHVVLRFRRRIAHRWSECGRR
jgi:hypothetical protein